MFDFVIKGGHVIDGTGAPAKVMDVAVTGGRIAALGQNIGGSAREVIDARRKLVTPGFLDIHTHYDGQVTWDDQLLPSSGHGVTTVVIGCCGVGFAPVRKGAEEWLVRIMEGVEDIPGTALHVGIPWGWESFTDYLDLLAGRDYAVDIGAQVPHSAVRAYVLGERAEQDEPATTNELDRMAAIVRDAIAAGAVGLGTSRVALHRASDGANVPGTAAPEEELLTLVQAMRDGGGGVFQLIPSGRAGGVEGEDGKQTLDGMEKFRDRHSLRSEIEMLRRIHRQTGQPVTFTFGENEALGKPKFLDALDMIEEIKAAGEKIHPQFAPRPAGAVISLDAYHIFTGRPSYRAIAHLPPAERAREMARPEIKAAILSESDVDPNSANPMLHLNKTFQRNMGSIYSLADVDYEPMPDLSILRRAETAGCDPAELFYDLLIADDGRAVLVWFATSYLDGDLDQVAEFLDDPQFRVGLGDGGAHVLLICDASFPTFLLTHWARDRKRGRKIGVEQLVKKLTSEPAELYGFSDRGIIAEGMRADINVIDHERLSLAQPRLVADLPTGAKRFLQDTTGYAITMVNGVVVRRDDIDTGARPGGLVRKPPKRLPGAATARPADLQISEGADR